MKKTNEELEDLVVYAESIISKMMGIIEELDPSYYFKSDQIMCADDWLKWKNDEIEMQEIAKIKTAINYHCA